MIVLGQGLIALFDNEPLQADVHTADGPPQITSPRPKAPLLGFPGGRLALIRDVRRPLIQVPTPRSLCCPSGKPTDGAGCSQGAPLDETLVLMHGGAQNPQPSTLQNRLLASDLTKLVKLCTICGRRNEI